MDRVQTGSTTKPGSSKPNNWDHGLGLSFGKMKWDGQWSRSRLTVQSVRHCWTLFKRTWSHIQSVRFWVLMDYIAQALTIETHNINESPLKKKQIGPKKEKIRYFYGTLGTAYKNHDISDFSNQVHWFLWTCSSQHYLVTCIVSQYVSLTFPSLRSVKLSFDLTHILQNPRSKSKDAKLLTTFSLRCKIAHNFFLTRSVVINV